MWPPLKALPELFLSEQRCSAALRDQTLELRDPKRASCSFNVAVISERLLFEDVIEALRLQSQALVLTLLPSEAPWASSKSSIHLECRRSVAISHVAPCGSPRPFRVLPRALLFCQAWIRQRQIQKWHRIVRPIALADRQSPDNGGVCTRGIQMWNVLQNPLLNPSCDCPQLSAAFCGASLMTSRLIQFSCPCRRIPSEQLQCWSPMWTKRQFSS